MSARSEQINRDSPHLKECGALPPYRARMGRGLSLFICVRVSA
jgi:hypothetical protein